MALRLSPSSCGRWVPSSFIVFCTYLSSENFNWYFSSADNSVRMWDRRNLGSGGAGSPIHKFEGHKAAVLCVQACHDNIFVIIFIYADMVISYIVFECLLDLIQTFCVPVVTWQSICFRKFCGRWFLKCVGSWEGWNSAQWFVKAEEWWIQFLYCFLVYFSRLNILFSFCDDRLGRKKILTYQLGFSFNMLVTGTMLLGESSLNK